MEKHSSKDQMCVHKLQLCVLCKLIYTYASALENIWNFSPRFQNMK